jgi:hypothetical protein
VVDRSIYRRSSRPPIIGPFRHDAMHLYFSREIRHASDQQDKLLSLTSRPLFRTRLSAKPAAEWVLNCCNLA